MCVSQWAQIGLAGEDERGLRKHNEAQHLNLPLAGNASNKNMHHAEQHTKAKS